MDKLEIVLDHDGVRELLRSGEIMAACRDEAEKIRKRAGDGYEISEYTGRNRVNVSVVAESRKAARENRGDKNALLKAVRG